MIEAKESSKDQPAAKKVETVSTGDNWQNSWDDKTNATTKVSIKRKANNIIINLKVKNILIIILFMFN